MIRRCAWVHPPPALLAGGIFFIALLGAGGCATQPLQSESLHLDGAVGSESVELTAVPFFPQEAYQCGPAALATVLVWSGVAVTPEALTPQVYLPARKGSLALELIAAARRHGRVPYVLRPELSSLLAEVAAGHPVVVLQNLGLDWLPRWHYAVVVGFDLERREVVLRSGPDARRVTPLAVFERTWRRGDYWAMVAMPPGELPRTAEEQPYLQAVAALERIGRQREAAEAYTAALARWPESRAARFGLGNARYALGDLAGAEAAFRELLSAQPDYAPAWNNLAQVLAEQGKLTEAEAAARRALALGEGGGSADSLHMAVYRETLAQILARQAAAGAR